MKKPVLKMLKKGSKINGDTDICVREDGVLNMKNCHGYRVRGPYSFVMAEGAYFRITWKEDKKCQK